MGRALLVLGMQNNTHIEGELISTSVREEVNIPKVPFCMAGGDILLLPAYRQLSCCNEVFSVPKCKRFTQP